tara:strand:- start:1431 stop:1679 length:249 start_codon:yes stop_codon:yes gene_type:complete
MTASPPNHRPKPRPQGVELDRKYLGHKPTAPWYKRDGDSPSSNPLPQRKWALRDKEKRGNVSKAKRQPNKEVKNDARITNDE